MRHFVPEAQRARERYRMQALRPLYEGRSSSLPHAEAMELAQQRAAIMRPLKNLPTPSAPASAEAIAGLGRLAVLPNEAVMVVLQHCSLQTVYKLRLANKAFDMMVHLLPEYDYVTNTVQGIKRRATPIYRAIMLKLEVILTYSGLRYLLTSHTCEKCGKEGGSLKLARVKVLCDGCGPRTEIRSR